LLHQILSLARLPISPPRLKSNANNATSAMIANNFRWLGLIKLAGLIESRPILYMVPNL
jgi:hypothetical protein